jgi:hypothetical protein
LALLEWDKIGERYYETGIDHGVLYLKDGRSVPWNGLRSVEEGSDTENSSFYLDGVKYLHRVTPGDFSGKLTAITYPDEFEEVVGTVEVGPGMYYYNQAPKMFDLSYRTRIGNDVDGTDHGYKLHVLYNLIATADPATYSSLNEQVQPIEFGWTLNGTPPFVTGHRPTVHVCIDSRDADPAILSTIEGILYGSDISNPRLPPLDELTGLMEMFGSLIIVDNGDGTWTAIDLADQYITMDSDTRFTIDNVDATYLDVTTYTVSTTTPD